MPRSRSRSRSHGRHRKLAKKNWDRSRSKHGRKHKSRDRSRSPRQTYSRDSRRRSRSPRRRSRSRSPPRSSSKKNYSGSRDWKDPHCNPHVHQVLSHSSYAALSNLPFERELPEDAPRERYRRRKAEKKSVIHWGQRKLLLSEIEFLTMYGSCDNPVVYAGAAPGTHLTKLAQMFPHHTFYCYDPAPFNTKPLPNLHTYQTLFTDELALAYLGKDVLFICDIRASDCRDEDANDVEDAVGTDMDDQQRWYALMQPVAAILKFRLPWTPGTSKYLSGKIYLPVFGPITTTESRLLVVGKPLLALPNHQLARTRADKFLLKEPGSEVAPEKSGDSSKAHQKVQPTTDNDTDAKTSEGEIEGEGTVVLRNSGFSMTFKDYDNTAYEEQMFYFNTKQRVALYPHDVTTAEGIDHCYDCTAEVQILTNFLEQVVGMVSSSPEEKAAIALRVGEISEEISRSITSSRTLASPNCDPTTRQKGIKQKQWIDNKPAYQRAHEIRAKQKANGQLPQLMVSGDNRPLLIGMSSSQGAITMEGKAAGDATEGGLKRVQKLSGTTISHPMIDRIRGLLQRQSTTFELPEGLVFKDKQTPTSSGWARCVAPDGVVLYINTRKQVCTTDAPSVNGWIVRRVDTSGDGSDLPSYMYEDSLSGATSVDVPEPIQED